MHYGWLTERAEAVAVSLTADARVQALRVVELAHSFEQAGPGGGMQDAATTDALRRELGSLVELLSRRGSRAIGVATLGRALLAGLAGDTAASDQVLRECDEKLSAVEG